MIHFDFNQDYILENEVALLRPLTLADFEHLKHWCVQTEIWKYSTLRCDSEEQMKNYITAAVTGREQEKEYPFVIIDKRTNTYAGCTRFYNIKLHQHNVSIGYTWYALEHQGTGLNKNCKYLLFNFAFQQGFERVEFEADNDNSRSIAAMKSIGCTQEGVLRSHMIRLDGSRRDTIVLSLLKAEWELTLKEKLKSKLLQYKV